MAVCSTNRTSQCGGIDYDELVARIAAAIVAALSSPEIVVALDGHALARAVDRRLGQDMYLNRAVRGQG